MKLVFIFIILPTACFARFSPTQHCHFQATVKRIRLDLPVLDEDFVDQELEEDEANKQNDEPGDLPPQEVTRLLAPALVVFCPDL